MGRIRTIKPEFPQSESMGRVSRDARLAFVLLWTVADDEGRLRGSPALLAGLLFPYDEDARKKLSGWLDELEREGCISRYRVGADSYIAVSNWAEHQKIDHAKPSKLPAPPDGECREASRGVETDREASRNVALDLDQGPRTKEGTKDQDRDAREAREGPASWEASFAEFWAVYPAKAGRRAAHRAYGQALKRADHAAILAGAQRYAHDPTRKPEFTKHPATWLNADCWLDKPAKSGVEAIIERMRSDPLEEYR